MKDPRHYLRHPLGRGQVHNDAEVLPSAYLSRDSIAAQDCELQNCKVKEGSVIAGEAKVFGGLIRKSFIGGRTIVAGDPIIVGSIVKARSVTGKALIEDSDLTDDVKVAESASVYDCHLRESSFVYGRAVVRGIELYGRMRLHRGIWTRTPRYVDLGFVSITESKLGAMVDCRDRTIDYWVNHGPRLGERWGWDNRQIAETLLAVRRVAGD